MKVRKVTADEFGDAWPLTVDECWLRRDPKTGALRVQVNHGWLRWRVYALNGIAIQLGDRDITEIHAPDPDIPSYVEDDGEEVVVRKSLLPLIDAAASIGV